MLKRKFILTITGLLLSYISFCQQPPKISFGILENTRVSVEEFEAQQEIFIEKGFKIDSIVAYFSGANFPNVQAVHYFPNHDSGRFSSLRKLIAPGSVVTFDVSSTEISTNNSGKSSKAYIFYSYHKKENLFEESPIQREWKRLRNLNYMKGTIYFSGSSFPNVLKFSINTTNLSELRKQFDRCGPGSSITFENVYYQDEENKTDKLNMIFTIQ